MAHQVIMPKQGLQMTEGYITVWKKKEGELVSVGEPLFEMETDKLNIVIDAQAAGTLLKIVHPEGATVPVTEVIAYIGEPGETIETADDADRSDTTSPEEPKGRRTFSTPRARMRAEERGVDLEALTGSGPEGLIIERDVLSFAPAPVKSASPLARAIADREGVQIDQVHGTGDRGKVMAADVRSHVKAALVTTPEPEAEDRLIPMDGMRRGIASLMKKSLETQAQANHRMAVDMSECVRMRNQLKAQDRKVGFTDIIIMAAARALREHPGINVMRDGDSILVRNAVNIGIAVETDQGLLVPVLTHVDRRSLSNIAAASADLAQRARNGRLMPDEVGGGTFTVTNLGMYGIDSFTAICNAPESAILAVGAIRKKPVVRADGTIVVRDMMWLSLSYDHCVIDGAPAARFLQKIAQYLEEPAMML